jgi:hypothetical protein
MLLDASLTKAYSVLTIHPSAQKRNIIARRETLTSVNKARWRNFDVG